eukprot:TRINITY_DN89183_c0_g1_i1.p1 TRINITY_DN89183_c0_g1~~TRINITY_DN89183_c0_g1_i1.p1  ORF type:complete len:284 (-),score=35.73 TRINITY_DN89183_c0_g1_i1:58-852(-)
MVDVIEQSGANVVICQWGFDDEANHLLRQRNLPAVRWVGGVELEVIAIATGGRIVPRFEDISASKLGKAGCVRETSFGTDREVMLVIEDCAHSKTATILVRGGNQMVVEEAKRCIHDALCCVRNLIRDNRILPGGGASEIAAALAVEQAQEEEGSLERYAIGAFADALMALPEALAENSGLNALAAVSTVRAHQLKTGNHRIGVNCTKPILVEADFCLDMIATDVQESLFSKKHQLQLATQVVKMILKIDDIIAPSDIMGGSEF